MRITQTIGLASAIVLAAGCAHEEHHAQYDESVAPSASQGSQYNSSQYQNSTATGTATESDNALVTQVRQALQQNAQIAPLVPNIQITANKGMVVLSGTVQSAEQKQQIQSIAAHVFGVDILDDQLRVSGGAMNPTSRPDSGSSVYPDASGKTGDQPVNQPANPTSSDTNSPPRIYHDAGGSNPTGNSDQNRL